MKPWQRKPQPESTPTRRRLQRLQLPEVYDWSEALLISAGRSLSMWRRGGGIPALEEARKQIEALLDVCDELTAREKLRG